MLPCYLPSNITPSTKMTSDGCSIYNNIYRPSRNIHFSVFNFAGEEKKRRKKRGGEGGRVAFLVFTRKGRTIETEPKADDERRLDGIIK